MRIKKTDLHELKLKGLYCCDFEKTFNFILQQNEIKYGKLNGYKYLIRLIKNWYVFFHVLMKFDPELIREGNGKHMFVLLPADLRNDIVQCVTNLESNIPDAFIIKFHDRNSFVGIKQLIVDFCYCMLWFIELTKYLSGIYVVGILTSCIKLIRHQRLFDEVDMNELKSGTFFYDAETTNNYFAQRLKSLGKVTITLQHGVMVAPIKELADNVDFAGIEFEGEVCDHFLVWNEFTKKHAVSSGIDETKVHIVGPLKCIGVERVEKISSSNIFCLILDGLFTDTNNRPMIQIANQIAKDYKMRYIVRFHPAYSKREFDDIIDYRYAEKCSSTKTLVNLVKECSFFIVANSTALIELSYCGALIYRYTSRDVLDKYRLLDYPAFINLEEFAKIREQDEATLKNDLYSKLCGDCNNLINNYIKFYNTIC